MLNKSVAVIDIRSSEITAAVAERGVNNTFIIKCRFSVPYEGYAEGKLLDVAGFSNAMGSVVKSIYSASGDKIKTVYVGVPGEFTELINAESSLSFSSMKRVKRSDVKALEEAAMPAERKGWSMIRSGCLYYVLSDKRRTVNPVGMLSDSLRGRLCFYYCTEAFIKTVKSCLSRFENIATVNFIPVVHAEAMYLIAPERRDDYAVLFDFGFISSTYSVVCGNGVAFSQSFSLGAGHLAVYLMDAMEMPYEVAVAMLGKVNLNSRDGVAATLEYISEGEVYRYTASEIKDKIREALDGICETLEECGRGFTDRNIDYKPICFTGECVNTVRGATDHISGRLVRTVNILAPNIPYYDKPQFSSLFSLLDMALSDREKSSFFGRFL